tara:strand:- start:850 stop:1875 length:1026 start_codon:yes stop_codon:yes gene_type:complete
MPSRIQELLEGRHEDKIDYAEITTKYPWIVEENKKCILSPDSDGLLCGLLMSHYLNWKIVGFYDGKVLILEEETSAKDCIFLDMEIFREEIKSVGHHMLLFNKNQIPEGWEKKFEKCIQPNNLRGYDGSHYFRLKYPLATIHMLLGILGHHLNIEITEEAIPPLFFTDGTFNVLFKYPENVLNWLNFLRANEEGNPLKTIFENQRYSVFTLMKEMDEFFRKRDEITISRERGDRLKISNTDGSPYNLIEENGKWNINGEAVDRVITFMKILSEFTGWNYKQDNWLWGNFKMYKFTKRDFNKDNLNVTNPNFNNLIEKNPLSWAMTSGQNIEYTLEEPDKLP